MNYQRIRDLASRLGASVTFVGVSRTAEANQLPALYVCSFSGEPYVTCDDKMGGCCGAPVLASAFARIIACTRCGGQGCTACDPPTHPGDSVPDDSQPFLPSDED